MRQVECVREVREKARNLVRAYERMEDWSPDELDLAQCSRAQWAEEQALVSPAHQVGRWARRLAKERGDDPPPRDELLANPRNALEHLDDAEFEGGVAAPGIGNVHRGTAGQPSSTIRQGQRPRVRPH